MGVFLNSDRFLCIKNLGSIKHRVKRIFLKNVQNTTGKDEKTATQNQRGRPFGILLGFEIASGRIKRRTSSLRKSLHTGIVLRYPNESPFIRSHGCRKTSVRCNHHFAL